MGEFFARIAVGRPFLFMYFGVGVANVFLFRHIVEGFSLVTVRGAPVVNAYHLTMGYFGVRNSSSELFVIFRGVVNANVFGRLYRGAPPSCDVPVTTPRFSARCRQTFYRPANRFLRLIVSFLGDNGLLVDFVFSSRWRTRGLCPFDLSREDRFLVSRVQRREGTCLFRDVMPPSFGEESRGRVQICARGRLVVRVPFGACLVGTSVFRAVVCFLIGRVAYANSARRHVRLFRLSGVKGLRKDRTSGTSCKDFGGHVVHECIFHFRAS